MRGTVTRSMTAMLISMAGFVGLAYRTEIRAFADTAAAFVEDTDMPLLDTPELLADLRTVEIRAVSLRAGNRASAAGFMAEGADSMVVAEHDVEGGC
jgi:hypothetical protein